MRIPKELEHVRVGIGAVFGADLGAIAGFDGEDLSKCLFFDGPWEDEIAEALSGWTNLTPRPRPHDRPPQPKPE